MAWFNNRAKENKNHTTVFLSSFLRVHTHIHTRQTVKRAKQRKFIKEKKKKTWLSSASIWAKSDYSSSSSILFFFFFPPGEDLFFSQIFISRSRLRLLWKFRVSLPLGFLQGRWAAMATHQQSQSPSDFPAPSEGNSQISGFDYRL